MAANITSWIKYLQEQVKVKSIYVWGAQGQLLKDIDAAWITAKEMNNSSLTKEQRRRNAERAIKLYRERKDIKGARAFDCSGLGVYYFLKNKLISGDKTANGLKALCKAIKEKDLRNGDLVFKVNKVSGKATHVGFYADGYIIEAQGRDDGVVKRKISATTWNAYGRPTFWKEEPLHLTRVLKKGMEGDDVKAVQERLIELGLALPKYGADGSFGTETENAVKKFQRTHKDKDGKALKDDGVVGQKTCEALGGTWK